MAAVSVWFLFAVGAIAEPVHLHFLCWDGDEAMNAIRAAASSFEAAHPNIKVKVDTVNANYQEKLLAQVAAGTAPDVVMMDPQNFQKYSVRHALLPLNDFIARHHYDIGAYYKNLVDAHSINGQLYVLPRDIAPISLIYYNKRMFDEAGIPYPDGTWTWDFQERPELREKDFIWVMHQLTKVKNGKTVQWGYSPSWQDLLWQQFLLETGARMADDYKTPTKMTLDDPRIIKVLKWVQDLTLTKGWIPSPTQISSELQSTGRQLFTQQKVAMYQSGVWDVPQCRKELIPGTPGFFEWDVAIAPAYKDGTRAYTTGGSGYGIISTTKHPEEAWALTSWMAGEPGMKEMAKIGLAQPAIRRLARSEPWIPGPNTPQAFQYPHNRIVTDQSTPYVIFGPLGTEWPEAWGLASAPFSRFWDGTGDPAVIIPTANKVGNDRLSYLLRKGDLAPFDWTKGAFLGFGIFGLIAGWVYWPELKIRRSKKQKRENLVAYLFVMPWLLGLVLFTAGPMILSLLMSFADWDIIQPAKFMGLGNYIEAFTIDPRFWVSIRVTLLYTVLAVPAGLAASLALAMLLNIKVKGIPVWRTCYYLPSLASGVAASLIWRRIFMPDGGLLNMLIYGPDGHGNLLGLGTLLKPWATNGTVNWLGSENAAPYALVIMSLWGAGGGMILLLAGLQGVPTYYYEAATLDGAGPFRRFLSVTVPLISPTLFFCLVTGFIGTLQVFTPALLMTNGGPNDSTLFFGLHMYNNGFLSLRMGYASCLAWVMFFIVMLFTAFQLRMSKWVYYEASK